MKKLIIAKCIVTRKLIAAKIFRRKDDKIVFVKYTVTNKLFFAKFNVTKKLIFEKYIVTDFSCNTSKNLHHP
jgi:hypothetical protein